MPRNALSQITRLGNDVTCVMILGGNAPKLSNKYDTRRITVIYLQ